MNSQFSIAWFCTISAILVLAGIVFAFCGLGILPVNRNVLLSWESAIYGAIMMGWGTTLFLVGRIAFRRNDVELMVALLCGLALWLAVEALFSAYFGVFFNIGVDIAVFALFGTPLVRAIRHRARPTSDPASLPR
jgi:cation transport ATPase